MHILIAPNAFKHSLTASEAAHAIAAGLQKSHLDCSVECFPIADGGDGTGGLIIERCKGKPIKIEVKNALGRDIRSTFGWIEQDKTAVIEMADASGLRLLQPAELNPMLASSFGTGQLIKAALDKCAQKIIIAMGGSATVDGGCGILKALGFRFFDNNNRELNAVPEALAALDYVDESGADKRIRDCEIIILCDVDNMLLGTQGAAAVFGPQKGADASMVHKLDGFLSRLNGVAERQTGKQMGAAKYGGTAGGAAAGLYAFMNARLVNGIDYFLTLTRFDDALCKADILITGEGSIDTQTLQGKGPFGVASRALAQHVPVIGIAGKVPMEPGDDVLKYFPSLFAIGNEPADLPAAIKNTRENLIRLSQSIGNTLTFRKQPVDVE